MSVDNELLRQLYKIQVTVPDKDFLVNQKDDIKSDSKKRKKGKGGLFSAPFMGSKKQIKVDIENTREKIKSFNNSFKGLKKKRHPDEVSEPGLMSVQEMKDFRKLVKETAEIEEESFGFRALEAIIKFIDLKNSGIISGKQEILFDCLKKLALVLMENGGLSMFHATWFHSIYKEYIRQFRMFRQGEYERASAIASKEAKEISRRLYQKQYELPHYLQLVDENKRDIKQLLRYSRDPYIKRSVHGQKGCTYERIRKIFHAKANADPSKTIDQTHQFEVNIVVSYAQFFSRFPMMHPLVEKLAKAIPNLNTETTLYKEKIMISLNLVQLDLMLGASRNEGTEAYGKKIFDATYAVFKRCTNMIRDNRLNETNLVSDIYAFPFLKQAMILISYKQILSNNRGPFLKMIENSQQILQTFKQAAKGPQRYLMKTVQLVDVYERNLNAVVDQITKEMVSENPGAQKKANKKNK